MPVPFSYVDAIVQVRDSTKAHDSVLDAAHKVQLVRRLVNNAASLTPHPSPFLEKNLLSLKSSNVSNAQPLWDLINVVITSTAHLSSSFLIHLLQSLALNVHSSKDAQSTLHQLLQTSHLYNVDLIDPLISLLSNLLKFSPEVYIDQGSKLLRILEHNFSHLRDDKSSQSLSLRLISHLAPYPSFHQFLPTFIPFLSVQVLLDSSSTLSDPSRPQFNSKTLVVLIPLLQSDFYNETSNLKNLNKLCLTKINQELTHIVQGPQKQPDEALELIDSITSFFGFALSHNMRFSSKETYNQSENPTSPKKKRTPELVEQIFHSLVLLFAQSLGNCWKNTLLIPKLSICISTILQHPNFTFDTSILTLLNSCASLSSPSNTTLVCQDSLQKVFISVLQSYSTNRRLPLFFDHLSSISLNQNLLARLSRILGDSSVKFEISRCLSGLPLGCASTCLTSLIPNSKDLSSHEKDCISVVSSLVLESATEKDVSSVIRCITERVVPLFHVPKDSKSNASVMFLLSSVFFVSMRDKRLDRPELRNFINSIQLLNISSRPPERKITKQTVGVDKHGQVIKLVSQYILKGDSKGRAEDGLCLVRLLCISIRMFVENPSYFEKADENEPSKWIEALVKQSVLVLDKSKQDSNSKKQSTPRVFVNIEVFDDVLSMVFSMSDVFDMVINSSVKPSLESSMSDLLGHCIMYWSDKDDLWNELFERTFIQRLIYGAAGNLIAEFKKQLKDANEVGCDGHTCQKLTSTLKFILRIPRTSANQEYEKTMSRKLFSLMKRSCCDKVKQLLEILLYCFNGKSDKMLLNWKDGWDNIENIECRIDMCKNTLEWSRSSSPIALEMIRNVTAHFRTWNGECMRIVENTQHNSHVHSQVLKIGMNIEKIYDLIRKSTTLEKATDLEDKIAEMRSFMSYKVDHIGWYSVFSKEQENPRWVQYMARETEDISKVLRQMEDCRRTGKNMYFHLQLAAFCILTQPGPNKDSHRPAVIEVMRHMLNIGFKKIAMSQGANPNEAFSSSVLCVRFCEVMLHRIESSAQMISIREMLYFNINRMVLAVSRIVKSGSNNQDAVDFSTGVSSCIMCLLKSQRTVYGASWSIINLINSNFKLAAQLSHDKGKAEILGKSVAKIIATVDWCYEQSEITKEMVKTVILTCAQCLCDELSHGNFEVPVLDALACLLRTLPKDTTSVLISTSSPSLTDMLKNIGQLAHRIEYDGQ